MKRITFFYDAACGLCQRCSRWLADEPHAVEVELVPFQTALQQAAYADLARFAPSQQLVALADTGEVYLGHKAWLLALWSTQAYRDLSRELSHPALQPFANIACYWISENRFELSRFVSFVAAAGKGAEAGIPPRLTGVS